MGDTWDTFRGRVGELWETVVSKIEVPWSRLVSLWDSLWTWIQDYLLPILEDLKEIGILAMETAVYLLSDAWEKFKTETLMPFWTWLSGTFIKGWQDFHTWLTDTVVPFLEETFGGVWDTLGEAITRFKDSVLGPIQTGLEALQGVLEVIHERLSALIGKWQEWLNRKKDTTNLPESPETPYSRGLRLAADQMERMATMALPRLDTAMMRHNQLAYQPTGVGTFRQAAGTTYNQQRQYSIQVGPNQMAGGVTPALLEATIKRVLTRSLGAGAR